MFTVKSSNFIVNEKIKIEYNGSLLLNKKDGENSIVFVLLVPDKGVIKIDCYYNKFDKNRIINHFKNYFTHICYYILTISGDPLKMFTKNDINFINDKLGSNFIKLLNKKNSWILKGEKHKNNIYNIEELVDKNSLYYSFPIDILNHESVYHESAYHESFDNVKIYPIHPFYDIKKHTFIKDESYISDKFLFIGANFDHNEKIENDFIDSPYEIDIDNIKRYMAVILLSETEEHVEKWNLCTIMQGVPVFSKFYKNGTIQFENEQDLFNCLERIKDDQSIGHKTAYELSKQFWEWNNLNWEIEQECFKKGLPLIKRTFNIQYITIIRDLSQLVNILEILLNQKLNGDKYINIYTTQYLYSELINIICDINIKIFIGNNINFKTQIINNIDYFIYLDSNSKYTKDYTKNIIYNFDILTNIDIIGKGYSNYCYTKDIPLGSLCCKKNNDTSVKIFENMIKERKITEIIYSVDPYEFSSFSL